MSVQTQIDRISGAVQSALAALSEKGVEVPAGTKVDGLAALIAAIEAGGGSGGTAFLAEGTITATEDTGESTTYEIETGLDNLNGCGFYLWVEGLPTTGAGSGVKVDKGGYNSCYFLAIPTIGEYNISFKVGANGSGSVFSRFSSFYMGSKQYDGGKILLNQWATNLNATMGFKQGLTYRWVVTGA
jgi:hypothetical protein